MPTEREYKAWARRQVTRAHGKPLNCPVCQAEVFVDEIHECPPGFTEPATPETTVGYGYNALNQCCRRWMLLGWPEVEGKPRLPLDLGGILTVLCKECGKPLHFDTQHPDVRQVIEGESPVAVVAGRIR